MLADISLLNIGKSFTIKRLKILNIFIFLQRYKATNFCFKIAKLYCSANGPNRILTLKLSIFFLKATKTMRKILQKIIYMIFFYAVIRVNTELELIIELMLFKLGRDIIIIC